MFTDKLRIIMVKLSKFPVISLIFISFILFVLTAGARNFSNFVENFKDQVTPNYPQQSIGY